MAKKIINKEPIKKALQRLQTAQKINFQKWNPTPVW